jgi:hypothetical protein
MRSLAKVSCLVGLVAAAIAGATAADAQSRHTVRSPDAYTRSFDAYDAVGPAPRSSVPNDAGGPAYTAGQRGLDSSSDFQLQGR